MPSVQDFSVKFGRDPVKGLEGVAAHPYFYGLININDTEWNPLRDPPDLSTFAVRCQRDSLTKHFVRLEPDYNYKLIAIKYSVYWPRPRATAPVFDNTAGLPVGPVVNDRYIAQVTAHGWTAGVTYRWNGIAWVEDILYTYDWYEYYNNNALFIENTLHGTRLVDFIRVTLHVQGSGSTALFGGQNIQAMSGGADRIPVALSAIQGFDYGFQALRCEYLTPIQGVLAFEFTNTHPVKDLYLSAMMYGMKIRL